MSKSVELRCPYPALPRKQPGARALELKRNMCDSCWINLPLYRPGSHESIIIWLNESSRGLGILLRRDSLAVRRQCEGEDRSFANLADHSDAAAMGFYDRFRDGKPHARSRDPMALRFAAIELVEELAEFFLRDARSGVGNMKAHEAVVDLAADGD